MPRRTKDDDAPVKVPNADGAPNVSGFFRSKCAVTLDRMAHGN